jgi:DNA-binding CsgD family transcriptional regulator
MPVSLTQYDALLHSIYDAALQPERWSQALAGVAGALGCGRGVLFTPAHGLPQGGLAFPHNIPQSNVEQWSARSVHDDPHVREVFARGLMREGVVVNSADLVPFERLRHTSFYKELWEPIDIARLCSGVIFDGTDAHKIPTAISVYRSLRDPPFGTVDLQMMQRLLPHISRALGVMYHLRDSEFRVAASLAALDRLPAGVVLLDHQGHACFLNTGAQLLLQGAGPVVLRPAVQQRRAEKLGLGEHLQHWEKEFQLAIAEAVAPPRIDAVPHFSQAVVLPDAQGKPGFVVHAAPLGGDAAGTAFPLRGDGQPHAVVFMYDLRAVSVAPGLLCRLFDFTPAEARSALQLLEGGSVDDMAHRAGVSVNTFKTQLQAAYAKSHTHRQVDLLKLLLALSTG